ncbi:unnamed protein product [Urochloa decumbens]|uniref:Uncharacterized protein n=1 Tax=Urochloa decumbens TaxID=240449 RepID=A0ABC9FJW4_9POAL
MRGNGGAYVANLLSLVVFSGFLVFLALCRPHPPVIQTAIATTINSTSLDESKVTVVFCLKILCNNFGHGWQDCYCCGANEECYKTIETCRSSCPHCNPKCPPPHELAMEDRPSRVTNSTLLK